MAIKPLNSIVGYSVGGNTVSNIILANGDITTNNITATGITNLGNVGNVVITGGSANYILKTDGTGNLSWTAPASTLTVYESNANAGNISNTTANVSGLLFDKDSGFSVSNVGSGNVLISLGSTFKTWVVTGQPNLVAQAEDTVQFIAGNNLVITTSNTPNPPSQLYKYIRFDADVQYVSNGNSNIAIPSANGNVNISAVGNANVLVVTGTGVNVAGTANISGNANVGNIGATNGIFTTVAGTLTTASQPNITSVGTLSSLSVSGNTTSGNFIGTFANGNSNIAIPSANGNINFSAAGNANVLVISGTGINVNGDSLITGNLTVDGNITYLNIDTLAVEDPIIQLQTGANGAAPTSNSGKDVGTGLNYYDTQARIAFMGWDVSNAEFGMASQASISSEIVTFSTYGNLRLGNLIGAVANGNSNFNIPAANGNINLSVAGNSNVLVVTGTGINVSGTLNATGNANVGNIGVQLVTANSLISNRSNVSVTTNTLLDEFPPSTYRTAKYTISASSDNGYQSVETLLVHDGTNSYITVYGSICSNVSSDILDISSNINGTSGNVTLYATSVSANTLVKVITMYLKT